MSGRESDLVLHTLFRQDGVDIDPKTNKARCWTHCSDDHTVTVKDNQWSCSNCGIYGDAMQYLTDVRLLDTSAADKLIKSTKRRHQKKPLKKYKKLFDWVKSKTRDDVRLPLTHKYRYYDADNKLVCVALKYSDEQEKSFMQATPSKDKQWYMTNATNKSLPPDSHVDQIPMYRLPSLLQANTDRPVWIVEGEKCVDAILDTPIPDESKRPVCTSLIGGSSTKLDKTDLSSLNGRSVLLVSDADSPGRSYMARLGEHLHEHHECTVKYVLAKGDTGEDVADQLEGNGWRGLIAWLERCYKSDHPIELPGNPQKKKKKKGENDQLPPPTIATTDEQVNEPTDIASSWRDCLHFRIIGIDHSGQYIYFMKKKTNSIIQIRNTTLDSSSTLISLAPLEFWRSQSDGGMDHRSRLAIADAIIRASEETGVVENGFITTGRGCSRTDNGDLIYHLGDRYLCDPVAGEFAQTRSMEQCEVILEPGAKISIVSDITKAKDYANDMYQSIRQYRFKSLLDARRIMGFMVSSLIGGALEFRPMIWLTAPSQTGKTYLITEVMKRFFGATLFNLNDPTPAGITQRVRNDSLPVIIDEFEPEERNETKWKDTLGLIRSSTSGHSERIRGTAHGSAMSVSPRFSAMLVSIQKPMLSKADASRLISVMLSPYPVLNWAKTRAQIDAAMEPKRAKIVRSAVIREAPRIIERVRSLQLNMDYADQMDSRSLQIHSALTAGVGWMSGDYSTTWYPQKEDDTERHSVLKYLLGCKIRLSGGYEDTLASVVRKSALKKITENDLAIRQQFSDIAEMYGMKLVFDEQEDQSALIIAYQSVPLNDLLRGSQWGRHINLHDHLMQDAGVYDFVNADGKKHRKRFKGQQHFAVAVSPHTLSMAGLDIEDLEIT